MLKQLTYHDASTVATGPKVMISTIYCLRSCRCEVEVVVKKQKKSHCTFTTFHDSWYSAICYQQRP